MSSSKIDLSSYIDEYLPEPILVIDTNGKISYATSSAESVLIKSRKNIISKNFFDFIDPDDANKVKKVFNAFLKKKALSTTMTFQVIKSSKEKIYVEAILHNMLNTSPINGILVHLRDISNYIHNEEQLKQIQIKLEKTLDQIGFLTDNNLDVIFQIKVTGEFTFMNAASKRIAGYDPEEMIGTNWMNYVPKKELIRYVAKMKRVLSGEEIDDFQTFVIHKDGHLVPVEFSGKLVKKEKKIYINGVMRDISKRITSSQQLEKLVRSLEEQVSARKDELEKLYKRLQESEEKYRTLFMNLPDGAAVTNEECDKILDINQKLSGNFNSTPEEMIGKKSKNVFPEEILKERMKHAQKALRSNKIQMNFDNRENKYFQTFYIPITFQNGKKNLFLVVKEITDLIHFEEKIRESEMKHRTIFEESTDAIVVIQEDTIVSANPRFSEILGYSIEEINKISSKEKEYEDKAPSRNYISIFGHDDHQTEQCISITDKAGKIHIIEKRTKKIIWDSKPAFLTIFSEVTEQKILEEQFKLIFKYSPIAISLNDSKIERILFVNDMMAQHFNTTTDELKGKYWKDLLPPDIYNKRYKIGRNAIDTNTVQTFYDVRDSRHLKTDYVPINMPDNTRLLLILSNDITDLKKKEEELRLSEEKYRALFEYANEAIVVAQDGFLRLMNPQFVKMVGYSIEDIQRTPFIEFIHPDDREIVFLRYQKRLKGDILPQQYNFRVIDKQGSVRWVSISAVLFEWEGRPATLNFITDITQQKQAEKELLDSEEKFRTITTSAQDSIIMINEEGNIVFWNQSSKKIFGYTQQEILGKPAHRLLASTSLHSKIFKGLNRFKDTGSGPFMGKTTELIALKKNGENIPIELSLSSVQLNGKWNAIGIVRDISERKELEEELKSSYDILEKKVEQRTAELHESEKRYKDLFEFAPVGIGTSDETGKVIDANKQMIKIMGYSNLQDLRQVNLKELYANPEDRVRLFKDLKAKGYVKDWLVQLKRKSGSTYHALLNIEFFKTGEKRIFFTTVRDVTELIIKQREISEAHEYLTTIIDSAMEQIMALDSNMCITMWNRSAVELTGYKAKEMIGKQLGDCPCFDNPRVLIDYMKGMLEGHDVILEDIIISQKDSGKRILRFSCSIIRSEKKEIAGFLFVGHDITSQSMVHGKLLHGTSYLINDTSSKMAIDVFVNLQIDGYRGLVLSRGDPASLQTVFSSFDTTMFFFDEGPLPDVRTIVSLEDMYQQVKDFISSNDPSVVFIDRLDYLIVRYSFKEVLSLLYRVNSLVSVHHAILLIHINPDLIHKDDLLFLMEEYSLLPSQKVDTLSISSQLYDLLAFIYDENQSNVFVPFQRIGEHFSISKVTTQKRVHDLERMGLIRISIKGRMKTVFVTKDGELLLHGRSAV